MGAAAGGEDAIAECAGAIGKPYADNSPGEDAFAALGIAQVAPGVRVAGEGSEEPPDGDAPGALDLGADILHLFDLETGGGEQAAVFGEGSQACQPSFAADGFE